MTSPIVIGEQPTKFTEKQVTDAAEDARTLIEQSAILRQLMVVDVIARRLFLLVRQGMENELTHGWEVEHPQLVMQILVMSAQEKSVAEAVKPSELRRELLETVLPVVDIFCQMELENASKVVSGSDAGSPDELGELLRGTAGDAVEQAGQRGEGSGGEAGTA